jgi:hypothetical protein
MARRKSGDIGGSAYVVLLQDHFDLLRRAYESFLVWECFGELLFSVHRSEPEYPRVHFFSPLLVANVSAAFDSFVINLYKFYDNQSHTLGTLVDVGVKRGRIPPNLEIRIRDKIKDAGSFAANKHIGLLRNRSVGHYRVTNEERSRSPLTTIDPTPNEIRDYFARLGEILQLCASQAPLSHSPFHFNQFERQITDTAQMVMSYFRGAKAP